MNNMNQTNEAGIFGRFLTPKEQRRLLSMLKQRAGELVQRDSAVIRLLIGSGMRIGECLAISTGNAADALKSGYLFIPKESRKKSVRRKAKEGTESPKAEACDLSIFLTRSVRSALHDLLALRVDAELDEALIVSRKKGNRGWSALTVRAFQQRMSYWAAEAGLPDGVSPHWLRHTHAKNIRRESNADDPNRVIQARLGHRSVRSSEIYGRLDREEYEAALCEVDGKMNGKPRVRLADLRRAHEGRV